MDHARNSSAATGSDIHNRPHCSAGAWNASEEARHRIADPLTNELTVGVVACPSHIVCHQRGEQTVNCAECRKYGCRFKNDDRRAGLDRWDDKAG